MSEHGPPDVLPLPRTLPVEQKYPEQTAEYILQRCEQPSKPKTWCADDSALPLDAAKRLERKLAVRYSEDIERIKPLAVEAIDKLLLIKGQPTAILKVEDSMKLDELGAAILREIKQRGLSATLTERSVEVDLAGASGPTT